ncbi:FecR family protein [Parapedobacter soli]|uniref:FecR family protein n=1 Tax=Parapedobacter soli TaxID=416955 RepID=UPI0021C6798E|nr:FecR family protein [Parapedobacter soli]
MGHDHQRIRQLIAQYLEGKLSAVDEEEFWGYVEDPSFEPVIKQLLSEKLESGTAPVVLDDDVQARILNQVYNHGSSRIRSKRLRWLPYAAAAVFIAFVGVGFLLYDQQSQLQTEVAQVAAEDIQPGGNKAVLTLADGRKMVLKEDQSGIVLAGNEITYKDGDPLTDLAIADQREGAVQWMELVTPKGGTYQVTLPDGTDVWLNSGSVLRYPIRFDHHRRVVELSGEAYFDVAHLRTENKGIPFLVKTTAQTVEVLGTQFNLSAYAEDASVKTTLVEGSVRITPVEGDGYAPVVLKAGQQSVAEAGNITIADVDVGPFTAWKEGYFHFKSTPFADVIKQMTRWYDIEVVFKGDAPTQTFSGKMSRNVSLKSVLNFFEGSGVDVTLVNGKLMVQE